MSVPFPILALPEGPNPFGKRGQRTQQEWEELANRFSQYASKQRLRWISGTTVPLSLDKLGELPETIDHTLLKVDADRLEIDRLCIEAQVYKFKVGTFIYPSTILLNLILHIMNRHLWYLFFFGSVAEYALY